MAAVGSAGLEYGGHWPNQEVRVTRNRQRGCRHPLDQPGERFPPVRSLFSACPHPASYSAPGRASAARAAPFPVGRAAGAWLLTAIGRRWHPGDGTRRERRCPVGGQIVITEKIQPGEGRAGRRRLPLRRHPPGRGPSARPAGAGGGRAGMEALVADPAAARRPVRHAPGGGRQQGIEAQGHPRGADDGGAGLAGHGLRPRGAADRPGNPGALRLSRSGHAGDVHRAGPADHPRAPSVAPKPNSEYAPHLRGRGGATASGPDLQFVADPHRHGQPRPRAHAASLAWGGSRRRRWRLSAAANWRSGLSSPAPYFEVVATADVEGGAFRMRHAPKERIVQTARLAVAIAALAEGFEGPLAVRVEDKRQVPPRLHDLPSLQKLCGSRFGWSAARTLEVAQELYDGDGKKVITYPRAETRYLPENSDPRRAADRRRAARRAGVRPPFRCRGRR